jgi:hypothetical protein
VRSANRGPDSGRRILAAAAGALLAVTGLLAWATPRPQGDLFLALSGGRDVMRGGLGRPDDWSFATGDRVWLHQNWGGDVVLYLAERLGGETGLLVLKALLLAGMVAAVMWAARARGAGAVHGMAAGALVLGAWPEGMILRANLLALCLAPALLGVLYRSRSHPRWIWGAPVLLAVWANVHGSFVFGLGMLGLWAVTATAIRNRGPRGGTETAAASPWAALAVGAALTAFANPFGLRNISGALGVTGLLGSVTEFTPLLEGGRGDELPWVFFTMVAVLGAGFLARRGERGSAVWVFDLALALVAVGLAFTARRFTLLAAVVTAPAVAGFLGAWAGSRRRARWVQAGAWVAAALVVLGNARWVAAIYDPKNPLRPRETLFERMVYEGTHFPGGAAGFLEDNGVTGRVFQEWRWEGYLRWHCPGLPLYVGGRAHQIYDAGMERERRRIVSGHGPAASLAALDVHLAVVPLDAEYSGFCERVTRKGDGRWVYVYCDQSTAVLADLDHPANRGLIDGVLDGTLIHRDEATAALSRAMALASPALDAAPEEILTALQEAVNRRPAYFAYTVMARTAVAGRVDPGALTRFLEHQLTELEAMPTDRADGVVVLDARKVVAGLLESLYAGAGSVEKRTRAEASRTAAEREIERLTAVYR